MIKLIIFDLDDTLISEAEYVKSGYTFVSKYIENKFNINSNEVFKKLWTFFENKEKNTFNKLLNEFKIIYTKEDIIELVKLYRNHMPSINFFDDVIPFLNKLKQKNIKTGIISDGYKETQKKKLEVLDAYSKFDHIILTDELGKEFWKPNPKAFELVLDKFNIKPEEAIYIGDNPQKDFYIKKYMPIKTIKIERSNSIYLKHEYLENIKEDITINGLNDVLEYLD